jgi:hypothetical protein
MPFAADREMVAERDAQSGWGLIGTAVPDDAEAGGGLNVILPRSSQSPRARSVRLPVIDSGPPARRSNIPQCAAHADDNEIYEVARGLN